MKSPSQSTALARLSDAYLAVMATVFLLFTGSGGYARLAANKFTFFWVVALLYLGGLLLFSGEYLLLQRRLPIAPKTLWHKITPAHWCLLAYLLFSGISALVSPYAVQAWLGMSRHEGFFTLCLYVLPALAVSLLAVPRPWHLYAFGASICALCLLALLQLAGYNPLDLYPQGYNYFGANIDYAGTFLSTVGNVDFLAAVLAAVAPACLAGLMRLTTQAKWLLLLPLLLSLDILIQSGTSGGLVGSLGAMLLVPAVVSKSKSIRCICAGVAVTGVIGGLLVVRAYPFSSGMLGELHALLGGHIEDSFGSGRIGIWKNVIALLPSHLLFGTGPDTLIAANLPAFTRTSETWGLIQANIDTAHNEYLNILVQQGLLALLAYLAALGLLLWRWLRHAPQNTAAAICGAGLLGYAIQAFFGISTCNSAPTFWLFGALLLAATPKQPSEPVCRAKPHKRRK